MIRTVISLDENEKAWLDRVSKTQKVSLAELIRIAIKEYHQSNRNLDRSDFDQILEKTKGIWSEEEGLIYQDKIRDEWE